MSIITKIKCFFGIHWWLDESEPDMRNLIAPSRVARRKICGFCTKRGDIISWHELKEGSKPNE